MLVVVSTESFSPSSQHRSDEQWTSDCSAASLTLQITWHWDKAWGSWEADMLLHSTVYLINVGPANVTVLFRTNHLPPSGGVITWQPRKIPSVLRLGINRWMFEHLVSARRHTDTSTMTMLFRVRAKQEPGFIMIFDWWRNKCAGLQTPGERFSVGHASS